MEELNQTTTTPNTGILVWIIVIIGVSVFAFYWFIIRPEQIKKECYQYAYSTPNLGDTQEWNTATNYYYQACLRRSGL